MSEIKVIKKKTLTNREPASGPLSELFKPFVSFVTIPFALMRGGMGMMSRVFGAAAGLDAASWTPAMDVDQRDGNLVVTVEVPGLKREEVRVELTGDALVITGERKPEHKEDPKGFHRWERRGGQFHRSIPLPEGAKTDHAKADLSDGVLKISIPVTEVKNKVRQMPVHKKTRPVAA